MKKILLLPLLLLLVFSCKKNDDPQPATSSRTELLTARKWQLKNVLEADGSRIVDPAKLAGTSTINFFKLIFEFQAGGILKAYDRSTQQVVNGGTWAFENNENSLKISVTGFSGSFPVKTLTATQLSLQQDNVPVGSATQNLLLDFEKAP